MRSNEKPFGDVKVLQKGKVLLFFFITPQRQSERSSAKVNSMLPLNKIAPDFGYRSYLYLSLFLRYARQVDKLIKRYTVIRDTRPTGNKDKCLQVS